MNLPRVLFFQGSFDPPHEGHRDCVMSALKFTNSEKAIVLANENNAWKPQMQPLQTRIQMLKLLFQGEPVVEIAENEEIKGRLQKTAHVIFLIGSDAWPRFAAKKEIPYPEICIICRAEGEKPKIEFMGKTITTLDQQKKGLSSTKVRELLSAHPEWFHQGLADNNELPLSPSLRQYIFDRGLYCPAELDMRKIIETSLLEQAKGSFSGTLSLKSLNAASRGGLSGNLSYILSDDQPQAFIKVYTRESGKKFYQSELRALKTLQQLPQRLLKTADQLYWSHEGADFCHLATTYVPEPDFGKVWKEKRRDLPEMSFSIGRAMRELHEAKTARASPKETNDWIDSIKKQLDAPFNALQGRGDALKARLDSLEGTSSNLAYTHRDPNLSNIIVGKKGVYFIDLEKMGSSIGEGGEPLGHPEYDYHLFIRSLHMYQFFYPIDQADEIEQAFKEGYGPTDHFTPSVDFFCRAVCLIKDAHFHLRQNNLERAITLEIE